MALVKTPLLAGQPVVGSGDSQVDGRRKVPEELEEP
jgi:hypothetical protein